MIFVRVEGTRSTDRIPSHSIDFQSQKFGESAESFRRNLAWPHSRFSTCYCTWWSSSSLGWSMKNIEEPQSLPSRWRSWMQKAQGLIGMPFIRKTAEHSICLCQSWRWASPIYVEDSVLKMSGVALALLLLLFVTLTSYRSTSCRNINH